MFSIYSTAAQQAYSGPDEFRLYADFLPHIGEFALAFAQLERWVTWGFESVSNLTRVQGNDWEAQNRKFATRIGILSSAFAKFDQALSSNPDLQKIISDIIQMNDFRNRLFHDSATGVAISGNEISIMKKRLQANGQELSWDVSLTELKEAVAKVLETSVALHRFVMSICPNAEKRVP